jgi:hypothetical protein
MSHEITIRLKMDIETGKKDITIELNSSGDLLPYEHEQKHREVVEQLLGQGILKPNEVGDVHIERTPEQTHSSSEKEKDSEPNEGQKLQEGA